MYACTALFHTCVFVSPPPQVGPEEALSRVSAGQKRGRFYSKDIIYLVAFTLTSDPSESCYNKLQTHTTNTPWILAALGFITSDSLHFLWLRCCQSMFPGQI